MLRSAARGLPRRGHGVCDRAARRRPVRGAAGARGARLADGSDGGRPHRLGHRHGVRDGRALQPGAGRGAAQGRGGGTAAIHRHPPRGRCGLRRVRIRQAHRPARGVLFDRRPGRDQPAHRPVGREGRPGADPCADRPGADAGGRSGSVPGAAAGRRVRRGQRVEPDGALAQERDRARGAGGQARGREPRRRPPDLPRRGAGVCGCGRARAAAPSRPGRRDRDRAAPGRAGASDRDARGGRTARDHRRKRRAAVPRRGAGAGRADRRAGDHHLQGQGPRARRPPAGLRRAGPVGHPGRVGA